MNELLMHVLARIKPSQAQEQETTRTIMNYLSELNTQLHKNHIAARAILGGSFAKGTWLANEFDVDIFVSFERSSHDASHMSDTLEKLLPKNARRVHGSRDYFQFSTNNIMYEIVPVLAIRIAKEAQNVTDVSPLHVAWVTRAAHLRDDIRLTKQFLKAHRLYGAESYLQGFSGHVVDILTIHYGGFEQLLTYASKWKDKTIIDPEKHYKSLNKSVILRHLNSSKTHGPLVVVDPIDKTRNASAAVGIDTFKTFILAARQFLKKPREDMFIVAPFDLNKQLTRASVVCAILLPLAKRDIRGNKLIKIYGYLRTCISEFGVIASNWEWDGVAQAHVWFVVREHVLTPERVQEGPAITLANACKAFVAAHTKTFERNGKLYAHVKRSHTRLIDALRAACNDSYVLERCERIEILKPE